MTNPLCLCLHLSFSSRVPREVIDKAWMNSENSMRPSCRETNAEGVNILHLLYFPQLLSCFDVLDAFGWKWDQTVRSWLFLTFSWYSPEAKTCHLWSLVRWMLLGCNLIYKWIPHKPPHNIYLLVKSLLLPYVCFLFFFLLLLHPMCPILGTGFF